MHKFSFCAIMYKEAIQMGKRKECLLYDGKLCDGCGECDRCDLDPNKICDNCMKCMGDDVDFRAITIAGIQLENENNAGV